MQFGFTGATIVTAADLLAKSGVHLSSRGASSVFFGMILVSLASGDFTEPLLTFAVKVQFVSVGRPVGS